MLNVVLRMLKFSPKYTHTQATHINIAQICFLNLTCLNDQNKKSTHKSLINLKDQPKISVTSCYENRYCSDITLREKFFDQNVNKNESLPV